ncbi:hypothetical protein Efla_005874 [Eimeria flavescens]
MLFSSSQQQAAVPEETHKEIPPPHSPQLHSLSDILANYPRSPFSKVTLKNGKQREAADSQQLLPPFLPTETQQAAGERQKKTAEEQPQSAAVSVHPEKQQQASVANFSLSANGFWLCAGRVSGAHGLKGHLKIRPATFAKTERFCTPESRVFFRSSRSALPFISRAVEEGRLLTRPGKGQIALVKLQGIDDRVSANSLAGCLVYVHSTQSLPLLPEKCILAAELVGFEVTLLNDANKTRVGRVEDVISKHDMRLKEEALGAADDCLQIGVYRDLQGHLLLSQHFKNPAPPPSALVASALHALGSDPPHLHAAAEESPVLFECEGCGLRFTDCTAAVCHEAVCRSSSSSSSSSRSSSRSRSSSSSVSREEGESVLEQKDALQWLLHAALNSSDSPESDEDFQAATGAPLHACGKETEIPSRFSLDASHGASAAAAAEAAAAAARVRELKTLEGPQGRAGSRLGIRFWERLRLGGEVEWEREGRFFPFKGEDRQQAAERALDFACSSRNSQGRLQQADWNNPADVAQVSRHLLAKVDIHPAAAACTQQHTTNGQSFLLPFVLGATVGRVDVEEKTVEINAPPSLLP